MFDRNGRRSSAPRPAARHMRRRGLRPRSCGVLHRPLPDDRHGVNGGAVKTRRYFRPIPCERSLPGARPLAGGLFGFREVEVLSRGSPPERLPADAVPALWPGAGLLLERAEAAREGLLGLSLDRPLLMGIINMTADSFSDGGQFAGPEAEIGRAHV